MEQRPYEFGMSHCGGACHGTYTDHPSSAAFVSAGEKPSRQT